MLDKTTMKFSHVKPGDTDFKGEGLRDFFIYRDLGVAEATAGKVLAQLVRANNAPEKGTGWHYHGADFHIVYMLKGWATLHVRGQGDAGRGRRLRAPAPRHRALPVRLLAGHGVSRGGGPGRLHVDRCDGGPCPVPGPACPEACATRRATVARARSELHVEFVDLLGLELRGRRSTRCISGIARIALP